MKTTKRLLAVLLALVLLCVGVPMSFAENETTYQTGDLIQFGTYPQTKVTETTTLKNAANAATWKSYDYYTGTGSWCDGNMTPSDYMTFADFFYDGAKYRAVKFTQYRQYGTGYQAGGSSTNQGENGYEPNTTYYFKYEPLTWRVLDPSTGYIMCESLIDAQAYQNTIYNNGSEYVQAINSSVYANDYATSSIRDWLNYDFYETAFTANQKENIKTTALNNDADSASFSQYNSAATNDKIFLLSCADALNTSYGFSSTYSSDTARQAQGTDYAKSQGLSVDTRSDYIGNSLWWLRTPASVSHLACSVSSGGNADGNRGVNFINGGIRPACKISNLTSDISQSDVLFSEVTATHTHQAGEPVIENEVAATCTQTGSYDKVTYCVSCGEELSRETITIPTVDHTPGEPVVENEVAATCKAKGSYDEVVYCTACGDELTRTPHEIAMLDHTPGEAVIENEVAATCKAKGSYDEVVYCTACGDELTRTPHETDMLRHVNAAPVKENEVAPTCTSEGSYDSVTYCRKCGDELNRETVSVKKLDHTPGAPTEETVRAATCTTVGEKKITVRCTECQNVISERMEELPALHHSYVATVTPATCTAVGYTTYTCERGDHSYVSDYTDILQHRDGDNDGYCDVCSEMMTGGDHCRYCGKIHGGLFGWLVQIFHNILAIFKR